VPGRIAPSQLYNPSVEGPIRPNIQNSKARVDCAEPTFLPVVIRDTLAFMLAGGVWELERSSSARSVRCDALTHRVIGARILGQRCVKGESARLNKSAQEIAAFVWLSSLLFNPAPVKRLPVRISRSWQSLNPPIGCHARLLDEDESHVANLAESIIYTHKAFADGVSFCRKARLS
jgi:hypothetical protein